MTIGHLIPLTELERDALGEVSNIAMARAANSAIAVPRATPIAVRRAVSPCHRGAERDDLFFRSPGYGVFVVSSYRFLYQNGFDKSNQRFTLPALWMGS